MINNVTIAGWLHQHDGLQKAANGNSYIRFVVAVPGGKDKNERRLYHYFRCTAFRFPAEDIAKLPQQGERRIIVVQGRLQQSRWKDAQGNPRSSVEILAERVIISSRDATVASSPDPKGAWHVTSERERKEEEFDLDDDIPF